METKTYFADRKVLRTQLAFGLVCLAMSIGSAMNFFLDSRYSSLLSRFGWGSVGVLGLFGSVWLIQRVVRDRKRMTPMLTIDADGIEWDGIGDVGRLPWSAIQRTFVHNHTVGLAKYRYLVIEVKNPADILASAINTRSQKRMQQTLSFLGSPACIPDDILDTSLEDIQLEIENLLYERRNAHEESPLWRQPDIPEPVRVGNR